MSHSPLPCPMCHQPGTLDTYLPRVLCLEPDCPMPPIEGKGSPHMTAAENAVERWNKRVNRLQSGGQVMEEYILGYERPESSEPEEPWHYMRECHSCGYVAANYLHCPHDGIQSECTKCGAKLNSVMNAECNCIFYPPPNRYRFSPAEFAALEAADSALDKEANFYDPVGLADDMRYEAALHRDRIRGMLKASSE